MLVRKVKGQTVPSGDGLISLLCSLLKESVFETPTILICVSAGQRRVHVIEVFISRVLPILLRSE